VSDIRIRAAVRSDEAAMTALDQRTWAPDNAITPPPRDGFPFFDHLHRPEEFLVAERDGLLLGFVRVVQPVPVDSNSHVRQIQGLAVDPLERRLGIGRSLLESACDEARRQGARRITLRTLSSNLPAIRLYESAGFRVEGVLPEEFLIEGAYVDDVLMGRPL
jgi:ribosomal protein S18 acetylase RimI-like enzyme